MFENVLVIALLFVIVILIVSYLVRARKRGEKCIGCPYAKNCSGHCSSQKK